MGNIVIYVLIMFARVVLLDSNPVENETIVLSVKGVDIVIQLRGYYV
jgi:hypothetical protein